MRFPRSLAVSGSTLFVAEGNRIWQIRDSTDSGTAISANVSLSGSLAFDSVLISTVPAVTGVFPSSASAYNFGGNTPSSASVSGNTGTLSFTGGVAPSGTNSFSVTSLPSPPMTPGGYALQVTVKNAGVSVLTATFPYFTRGDGRLESMTGNTLSLYSGGLAFPYAVSSTGFLAEIPDFSLFPSSSLAEETTVSDRIVEGFSMSSDTKVLTLSYVEYVRFDCVSGRHVKRQRVIKIPLR